MDQLRDSPLIGLQEICMESAGMASYLFVKYREMNSLAARIFFMNKGTCWELRWILTMGETCSVESFRLNAHQLIFLGCLQTNVLDVLA